MKNQIRNIEDALYADAVDVTVALDGDLIIVNSFTELRTKAQAQLPVSEIFCIVSTEDTELVQMWERWCLFGDGIGEA